MMIDCFWEIMLKEETASRRVLTCDVCRLRRVYINSSHINELSEIRLGDFKMDVNI